jgi:aryl-alcohol dehydrogenase-like predicted oxidoreductase
MGAVSWKDPSVDSSDFFKHSLQDRGNLPWRGIVSPIAFIIHYIDLQFVTNSVQVSPMAIPTTVQLGNRTIAPIGVGTWAWGDSFFWTYGKDYGEAQVSEAFRTSLEAGVTLFDTAEVYGLGESERILGRLMKSDRDKIYIATKYMPVPWRFREQQVSDAVKASLDRLGVDSIDLYQIHQPVSFLMSQLTLLKALAREVEVGHIGALGVSNYSASQMREAHATLSSYGIPLAVNQMQYSLLNRKIESNGVLETARELGVTILAYSPLAQGLLTGKYQNSSEGAAAMGARKMDARFKPENLEKIKPVVDLLTQIGQKHDRTPAQVALNWLMSQPGVIPIPGAKTADQAAQNAGAIGWSMTEEEVEEIDRITRPWR